MTVTVTKPQLNLREELSALKKKSGIKGEELLRANTSFDAQALLGYVGRNKIINGDFQIWQRNTSATPSTSTGYLTADRWQHQNSASFNVGSSRQTFTVGQTEVPGNPTYYFRYTLAANSAAGDYGILEQRIEDVTWGSGEHVTLSFYAKSSVAGNKINIEYNQYCGPGGTGRFTNVASKAVTLGTSWAYYSVTLKLPNLLGKTVTAGSYLELYLWCSGGSTYAARNGGIGNQSGDFDFACIQLERGSVATPFEFRPYGSELALCQRYYQPLIDGQYVDARLACVRSSAGTTISMPITFIQHMRAAPSVSAPTVTNLRVNGRYGDTALTGGTSGVYDITSRGCTIVIVNPSASGWTFNLGEALYINGQTATTAILYASAEL